MSSSSKGNVGYALSFFALGRACWDNRSATFLFSIAPSEGAQHGQFPMPDILLNPEFDDQQLLAQVMDYYNRTLKETTEGLDYLRSRGVTWARPSSDSGSATATAPWALRCLRKLPRRIGTSAPGCSNSACSGPMAANT